MIANMFITLLVTTFQFVKLIDKASEYLEYLTRDETFINEIFKLADISQISP